MFKNISSLNICCSYAECSNFKCLFKGKNEEPFKLLKASKTYKLYNKKKRNKKKTTGVITSYTQNQN